MTTLCERPASQTTTRPDTTGLVPGLEARTCLERMGWGAASPPQAATTAAARLPLAAEAQARLEPECLQLWRINLAVIRQASAHLQAAAPDNKAAAARLPQQQPEATSLPA